MSFTNDGSGNMVMPVGPMNGFGGGTGMWGDGGIFWLLVLFIFAGFGGNGWGNGSTNTDIQRGFDQQAIMGSLNGITSSITNGFAQAEISANSRQMADMNQNFALQMGINGLGTTLSSALRDVLEANNASTQRILDTMCQDKIDAKNEKIAELQNQLTMANLAASQNAQTSQILADNAAQTQALEHYLNPTPIPAYAVANPNGCGCSNRFMA